MAEKSIVKVDKKVQSSPDGPDEATSNDLLAYESKQLEHQAKRAEIAKRQAEADDLNAAGQGHVQDNASRRQYARSFFYLTAVWLIGPYALLLLQGFKVGGFSLDSEVMLALIGATTVNVLGFLAQVAAYLYHRPKTKS